MHRRELLHPDVLEDAEDGNLPRLIDQRVVSDNGEVEMHLGDADRFDFVVAFDGVHDVHPLCHLSKNRMNAIQVPLG